jgi:hypothetical protein
MGMYHNKDHGNVLANTFQFQLTNLPANKQTV